MHIIAYTLTNSIPLHLPAFICIYVAVSSDDVSVYVLTNVEAIFGGYALYRIGFCSVSKVAPVQCEQELIFCCDAEIVPKRSQCEQKPYPLCNLQRSLLI